MDKEQEQAIWWLEEVVIDKEEYKRTHAWVGTKTLDNIEIVLNLIQQLQEEKQYIGLKVRNKISGKCGIVLHINSSGSVAVLESIEPKVVNTHDSWKTLEVIQNNIFKRK